MLAFVTKHFGRRINVGLMLGHRLKRWPNIKTTLLHRCMFAIGQAYHSHSVTLACVALLVNQILVVCAGAIGLHIM